MGKVNFISTLLAKYNALATKDADTLYFVEDAKKIYKGTVDVTEAIKVVAAFDEVPGADIVEGKLYFNATTFEVRVKNGNAWATMLPGTITAGDDFKDENGDKLATIAATKAFIMKEINAITGGTAFVTGLEWKDGKLFVDNNDGEPDPIVFEGVAHDPTYDAATLKLTIPVYGKEDVVINIPKDNFVRSGRYEKDYDLGDGTTGPAIVLVVNDGTGAAGSEVVIPAASLVDIYKGGNTNSAKVTISEDNVVVAEVVVDPKAGNAIIAGEAGLYVDLSGKADKLTAEAAGHILVADAAGNLADGGLTLRKEGAMGDSATEVPVASLIAAAITAAVNASQQVILQRVEQLEGRVDALTERVDNIVDNIVGEGNADEVVVSTEAGIVRSGKKIGGAALAANPDANTLATEKGVKTAVDSAVTDAMSWKSLD